MKLPFTKRKKLIAARNRYSHLIEDIGLPRYPSVAVLKEAENFGDDICLFVSYSANLTIKPSVRFHIESLIKQGVDVVLILNTDEFDKVIKIEDKLINNLSGFYVRENVGLDFGAWSDIYRRLSHRLNSNRLWLINDSIQGPINQINFIDLLKKIRISAADFVGLTVNSSPKPHLQSFFLVLKKTVYKSEPFNRFFSNLHSFRDKIYVIDSYEVNFTDFISGLGYDYEAIFNLEKIPNGKANDTIVRWRELIEVGFPYIKFEVIKKDPSTNIAIYADDTFIDAVMKKN